MNNDKVTTIIAADYMYLVFLGDDGIMDKIVDKLNNDVNDMIETSKNNKTYKSKIQQKRIYMKYDVSSPCIDILESNHISDILRNDAINDIKKLRTKSSFMNDNKEISEQDIDVNKKYVTPDEGVETAQCLTYADLSCNDATISKRKTGINNLMMLMVMVDTDSHYKLSFPILQLDEEENPDKLISKWLKDHKLEELVVELTIRPINIVGNDHDILVFAAFVNE